MLSRAFLGRGLLVVVLLLSLVGTGLSADPETIMMRARKLVRDQKHNEALKLYEGIAKWLEKDPERLIEWARTCSFAGRHAEAVRLFEHVAATYPAYADKCAADVQEQRALLVLDRARILVKQKKYDQAIADYESIAAWLKRDPGLLVERARAYEYAGRNSEAVTQLEEIIRDNPASDKAIGAELDEQRMFVKLGQARQQVREKNYDAAIREYDSMLAWLKRDPGLLVERARAYEYAGRNSEAVSQLEEILRDNPASDKAIRAELDEQRMFVKLGQARQQVRERNYDAAILEYDGMLAWLKRDPGLLVERARAYEYAGRNSEAATQLEEIIRDNPASDKAIGAELDEQRMFVKLGQARQQVREKNYEAAIREYDGMLAWLKRDPGLLVERTRAYEYAGRNSEAVSQLEEILRDNPASDKAIRAELDEQRMFVKLGQARQQVREKNYEAAIREYDGMLAWLKRDPGLLVERTRAYEYAGKHAAAITNLDAIAQGNPGLAGALVDERAEQAGFIELETARKLVEAKDYTGAIEHYKRIMPILQRDPGLLIEFARVFAYNNQNSDALQMLEAIRRDHPECEPVYLREMAALYSWNDELDKAEHYYGLALERNPADLQARIGLGYVFLWTGADLKALAEFDSVLRVDPENVKAMIGKADTLSFMDRQSEASDLLRAAATLDPKNVEILNLQARIMVWQGYHRQGAAAYRNILQTHTNDLDALEGLAFALYWDNREPEATDVLKTLLDIKPSRREASQLMYRIAHAKNPYTTVGASLFDDYNSTRVMGYYASGGVFPGDLTQVQGEVRSRTIEETSGVGSPRSVDGAGVGITVKQRVGEQISLQAPLYLTHYDANNWCPLTANPDVTWHPLDVIFLSAGYNREVIEKVPTIVDQLILDGWKTSAKWKPDRFWMFDVDLSQMFYSDNNQQDALLGIAEFRLHQDPYAKVYYNYYHSGWEAAATNYFSPKQMDAHTLGLYVSQKISPSLFIEGQGSIGRERQEEHSGNIIDANTMYVAAGLTYRPTEKWRLSARGQYFESFEDLNSNYGGYRDFTVVGSITYFFGGTEERVARSPESIPPPSVRNR